jgi:quercetin dioxygenase-like cupin family protein
MIIFRYGAGEAKPIDRFGSSNVVISRLAHVAGEATIHWIYLHPGGVLGSHPAVENQLFLVVQGSGWVSGAADETMPITAGQAAFWEAGERHTSRTDTGMTAIVVEGKGLDPAAFI